MGTRQGCERSTVICDIGSNVQSSFLHSILGFIFSFCIISVYLKMILDRVNCKRGHDGMSKSPHNYLL